MIQYQILSGLTAKHLSDQVTACLVADWELHGHTQIVHENGSIVFYQTIVRYK